MLSKLSKFFSFKWIDCKIAPSLIHWSFTKIFWFLQKNILLRIQNCFFSRQATFLFCLPFSQYFFSHSSLSDSEALPGILIFSLLLSVFLLFIHFFLFWYTLPFAISFFLYFFLSHSLSHSLSLFLTHSPFPDNYKYPVAFFTSCDVTLFNIFSLWLFPSLDKKLFVTSSEMYFFKEGVLRVTSFWSNYSIVSTYSSCRNKNTCCLT